MADRQRVRHTAATSIVAAPPSAVGARPSSLTLLAMTREIVKFYHYRDGGSVLILKLVGVLPAQQIFLAPHMREI